MADKRACRNCKFSKQMYRPCEAIPTCEHPEDPKGRVGRDGFCLNWRRREEARTAAEDKFDNPHEKH